MPNPRIGKQFIHLSVLTLLPIQHPISNTCSCPAPGLDCTVSFTSGLIGTVARWERVDDQCCSLTRWSFGVCFWHLPDTVLETSVSNRECLFIYLSLFFSFSTYYISGPLQQPHKMRIKNARLNNLTTMKTLSQFLKSQVSPNSGTDPQKLKWHIQSELSGAVQSKERYLKKNKTKHKSRISTTAIHTINILGCHRFCIWPQKRLKSFFSPQ